MPRGQPDFGIYAETPVASGISDPGEAAARLSSINVYDRRGWTVWQDDFEAPVLKWVEQSSMGGILPTLSTERAWMGVQSAYLSTPAVDDEWAALILPFPLLRLGRVGMEFFLYLSNKTPGFFEARLLIHDGTNLSIAQLDLDRELRTARMRTATGDVEVATKCFNTPLYNIWVPIKLVVDMDTDRYTRLLIGPTEIDLSAYALVGGAPSDYRFLQVDLRLRGTDQGTQYAYLDNFILTQNEP